MIRLVLILCAGLYLALMVLGEDRGQKRYGLLMVDQPAPEIVQQSVEAEKVVFIPSQTVMKAPATESAPVTTQEPAVAAATVTTVVAAVAQPLPEPDVPGGRLFSVASNTANVREGPGKGFAVLNSLSQGEQVLVIAEDNPTEGWSRVRLEGDGVEGYIATRLLTE